MSSTLQATALLSTCVPAKASRSRRKAPDWTVLAVAALDWAALAAAMLAFATAGIAVWVG